MTAETLVRMPRLADTLVEGTVARWLKQPGETVAAGEPLVEIETDKVSTELVAPASGILAELAVPEGRTVPVETVIARIAGEMRATPLEPAPAAPAEPGAPAPVGPELYPQRAGRTRATPVAARLLEEHGLHVGQVQSGGAGRVTKQDVLDYVALRRAAGETWPEQPGRSRAQPGAGAAQLAGPLASEREAPRLAGGAPAPFTLLPLTSMRRTIADHLARARATIPHGQTVVEADLTALAAWREREKALFQACEGAGLTFTVLFVAALGRELAHTGLYRSGRDPSAPPAIDLGVAVALPTGLIVPVVRHADGLALGEAARAVDDLAGQARAGTLTLEATQGALMTVTNVGSFGSLTASPIVPLGQLGILGPGLVERRPMPGADGAITLGWRCLLALVFDRRRLADFQADRLLRAVVQELDACCRTGA